MKTILAIDPGASGGFAFYCRKTVATGRLFPESLEMKKQLQELFSGAWTFPDVCYLELITGWVAGSGATNATSFKMGRNFGNIEANLAWLEIPTIMVPARNWQSHTTGSLTRKACEMKGDRWKSFLAQKARESFPGAKVTLQNADALLILKYAMHREGAL